MIYCSGVVGFGLRLYFYDR